MFDPKLLVAKSNVLSNSSDEVYYLYNSYKEIVPSTFPSSFSKGNGWRV